jgi:hypothetical protein
MEINAFIVDEVHPSKVRDTFPGADCTRLRAKAELVV